MASQRRQILQLMGIDVWVERHADAGEAVLDEPQVRSGAPVLAASAELRTAAPTEQLRSSPDRAQEPAPPQTANPQQAAAATAPAVADDFPACRILALRQGRLLLLTDMTRQALARRLGRDLLASIAVPKSARVVETLFDWQPEQVSAVALNGRRALAAFINRQLDDLEAASTVVVCTEVHELLPELAQSLAQRSHGYLAIASLQEVAVSAAVKRALWAQLQQLRQ